MNLAPQHDQQIPPAEWHGGVAERAVVRSVSEGVSKKSTIKTPYSVLIWLALWSLLLVPTIGGFAPTADDLGAYHLPLRAYYQAALEAGDNWSWCPWIFSGYHLHGEGQIGGDHPLHQLLYRTLPLHWAFSLECWWAYPATFFGMWWWLRQLRLSPAASQVSALAFSLCGFMTLRVVHTNAVQVIAHIPWLLGCMTWLEHRARHSKSLRSLLPPIAFSALLTGAQLLLGYPQYVVFTLIAEGLWLASLMMRSPQIRRTLALSWIAAKGLGLLLGAAQVLPTLEYLSLSERVNWSREQMFEGSWPVLNLIQLVAPYLFKTRVVGQNTHELTIFMGSLTVCLVVLGLVNRPQKPLRVVRGFAIALGVAGLLLALGDMSPLAEIMPYIPVWNRFRFPCRATLLLCLGVALLAALGTQALIVKLRRRDPSALLKPELLFSKREWRGWALLLICCFLCTLLACVAWRAHLNESVGVFAGPMILFGAMALLTLICAGEPLVLLRFAMIAELLFYAFSAPAGHREFTYWGPFVKLDDLSTANRSWRAADTKTIYNTNIAPSNFRQGKYSIPSSFVHINGYAGVAPARHLIYDDQHPGALRAAGVNSKWVPDPPQNEYREMFDWPIAALPRATLVTSTVASPEPRELLEDLDLKQTAIVESELNLPSHQSGDAMAVDVVTDRAGRLELNVDTNRDALLVTTESFHPGWHARVDNAEVPVLRVNGDFLGVRVPATAQRVECYFSDNWHAVGRVLSLGSLGLLGLVLCWSRTRQHALGFAR